MASQSTHSWFETEFDPCEQFDYLVNTNFHSVTGSKCYFFYVSEDGFGYVCSTFNIMNIKCNFFIELSVVHP